jgi:hypothetical protein
VRQCSHAQARAHTNLDGKARLEEFSDVPPVRYPENRRDLAKIAPSMSKCVGVPEDVCLCLGGGGRGGERVLQMVLSPPHPPSSDPVVSPSTRHTPATDSPVLPTIE